MAGFNINDLLNAKSKGAAVQAEGPAEQEQEFKVTMLDVEDLMPSKDNFYSTENIDELAMSIELVGHIEQNLVVKPEAHGKYEVVAGHRRRLAALKLVQEGKEEYRKVPCLIKKESDTIKDKLSSKAHSDPASVSKGDIVTFTGGGVYESSTAEYASVQKNVTSTCKVTAVNTKGTHPYHCISQDGKGVYGWVNAADVK